MFERLRGDREEAEVETTTPKQRSQRLAPDAPTGRTSVPLQRKLEVGSVDDPLEREADLMASHVEQVLASRSDDGTPPTRIRRAAGSAVSTEVGPEGGDVPADVERNIRRGGGETLDDRIRPGLESAFGHDFGDVRVHRDSADAPRIGARAFTIGRHIHFAPGQYDPSSAPGRHTLAHELTHVVQQGGAKIRPATQQDEPDVHRQPDERVRRKDGDTMEKVTDTLKAVKDAFQVFEHADPATVGKIADAWYAKKKGDVDQVDAVGKGAQADGGAGAAGWALGSAEEHELGELGTAYDVLVQAGFVAGANLNLSGALKKELGPNAVAAAKASFKAFGGVYVKALGKGFVRKGQRGWWDVGGGVGGKASAMAGVKAKAEVEGSFKYKDLGLNVGAEAEGLAGAEASAEGDLVFDPTAGNIAIGGKLSAFAGVKASAKGKISGTLYGREAIKWKVGGSVSAGAGGSIGGKFKLKGGLITIKLNAQATIGLGAGGSSDLDIDMKPFAVFLYRQASKRYWAMTQKTSPDKVKDRLANPQQVEGKLGSKLETYAKFKQAQLKTGNATNYVKPEKVQGFIDEFIPRQQIKGTPYGSGVDAFLKRLLETKLALPTGPKPTVVVEDGAVKKLDFDKDEVKKLSSRKVKGQNDLSPETGTDLGAIGDL